MPPVFVDPVAEPRGAAGGRSSNIIISVRPERPSSIVAPQPHSLDGAAVDLTIVRPAAAAPPRRLEQVGPIAGRSDRGSLADRRRWLGAPLAFSPNARPHHLRPEPDSAKKNSIKRNGDVGSSRAPRAPAREKCAPQRLTLLTLCHFARDPARRFRPRSKKHPCERAVEALHAGWQMLGHLIQ